MCLIVVENDESGDNVPAFLCVRRGRLRPRFEGMTGGAGVADGQAGQPRVEENPYDLFCAVSVQGGEVVLAFCT